MNDKPKKTKRKGGARKSTNPRSKLYYEKLDYIVSSVDRWIPMARKFRDLFGIIDLIAVGKNRGTGEWETVFIQATASQHIKSHMQEMVDDAMKLNSARMILNVPSNVIEFHGWKKVGRLYQVEILRFRHFEDLADHIKMVLG